MPIDMRKHREAFLSEARSHLKTMNYALVELEKDPHDKKNFQLIFRSAHTLKSISGAMKYDHCMNLCHAIENLLDLLRNEPEQIRKHSDFLFKSFDFLTTCLDKITADELELDSTSLIAEINSLIKPDQIIKPDLSRDIIQLTPDDPTQKIQAIEVKVERLDNLMNLTEELLVNKMRFDAIDDAVDMPELSLNIESLGRLISDLQYHVMQIRLIPIGFVFTRFLRMTRDLAKSQNKQIELDIEGGDIELDRMLADEIGESISHLIRNAIDHGLETPQDRTKHGKPPTGIIHLRAARTKDAALIEVSDDGAGLNIDAIKATGLEHKLITKDASPQQINDLIFTGLSTKEVVTELSGRGLGLGIVKQKIESIGGSIRVSSTFGKGTTFRIEIPLSLAIIKALFVKVNEDTFALPIESVERLLVLNTEDFKGLLDQKAIIFENDEIPVVHLGELFGNQTPSYAKKSLVIVRRGDVCIGLVVDDLLSTQEVVVKPLSLSVRKNKFFSGAALVGSGEMVLIIDVTYLLQAKKAIPDLY